MIKHEHLLLVMKKEVRKHMSFFSFKELSTVLFLFLFFFPSSFIFQKPHASFRTAERHARFRMFIKEEHKRISAFLCAAV